MKCQIRVVVINSASGPPQVTSEKFHADFDEVLAELRGRGVLLVHAYSFPSLTRLAIGEPIRGSWWAHPLSNEVYKVSQRLQHCGEVALIKLVSRKRNLPASPLVATPGGDRNFAGAAAT